MKLKSLVASLLIVGSLNASAFEIVFSPFIMAIAAAEMSSNALGATSIMKEQVAAIQDDALGMLAGDGKTDALDTFMNNIRSQSSEFADLSDEEIAIGIINSEI